MTIRSASPPKEQKDHKVYRTAPAWGLSPAGRGQPTRGLNAGDIVPFVVVNGCRLREIARVSEGYVYTALLRETGDSTLGIANEGINPSQSGIKPPKGSLCLLAQEKLR